VTEIVRAASCSEVNAARRLFAEYAASLDVDLGFQGFSAELEELPGDYAPPSGALLLAMDDEEAVGCVARRPFDPPCIAEMKRLYVVPSARDRGIGARLAAAARGPGGGICTSPPRYAVIDAGRTAPVRGPRLPRYPRVSTQPA
jgi:N-acetylglutamate synthase-like GNAT family acetyltransferase